MATLICPWIVTYHDPAGRRVKKGDPGAKRRRVRASKWYGQGIPGLPPKKRVPLATDKAVARRMLDDMVRKAERGGADLPDRHAGRRPLAEYLTAFERDVRLGLASRSKGSRRRPSDPQVALTVQRVRDIVAGCEFETPGDLNSTAAAVLASYLHDRTRIPRKEGGLSQQSAAFFLTAARRFVWWLSVRAKAPVRADLFDDLPGFNPAADRRHARREVAPDELANLLAATRDRGVVIRGLTGEDRYFLYLTAFATGYRAGELAELVPENFELESAQPVAVLPARFTKNQKAARQPLPPGVAAQLRPWMAGRTPGLPVWPGTWSEKPVKVLRRDLALAGVPYRVETPDGPRYADFHSLRHSFLTSLAAAGVGVKELQELARHSDPKLTLSVYTHTRPESLGAAVARLQLPGGAEPDVLSRMSRSELESTTASLLVLVAALGDVLSAPTLLAPRLAPNHASGRDVPGSPKKNPSRKRTA